MKGKLLVLIGICSIYCFSGYRWIKIRGPIVIYSNTLLDIGSIINGFEPGKAKGMAGPPPFILLREKDHDMNDIWIQHERIHQLQMTETLFLISIRSQIERIYARYILHYTREQAYLRKTTEQEAYLHQEDNTYIKKRRLRTSMQYVRNKVTFHLENYHIIIDE